MSLAELPPPIEETDGYLPLPSETASHFRDIRLANDVHLDRELTVRLPQGNDDAAEQIFERVMEGERLLAAPHNHSDDYTYGTARVDDGLYIVHGSRTDQQILVTAEHATAQQRLGKDGERQRKGEDFGTAGLGYVLHEDAQTGLIVARGRQTGDGNNDVDHPLKDAMRPILAERGTVAHVSLHGIMRGKGAQIQDTRGMNVILGVGDNPTAESLELAERLQAKARDYGLLAGINQPVVAFRKGTDQLLLDENGQLKTVTFKAAGEGTTRTFAQRTAEELNKPLATVQAELADPIRARPENNDKVERRAQVMGVYACYLFMSETLGQ